MGGSRIRLQPCQLRVERRQLPTCPFETLPFDPAGRHGTERDLDLLIHQTAADGELVEPVGEAEAFQLDGGLERLPLDPREAGTTSVAVPKATVVLPRFR
jgi:hypothetical protein